MALTVSNGYVIYQRGEYSKSPYWRSVYNKAKAESEGINSIQTGSRTDKLQEAGQRLISLGQAEMSKEIALIEAATGMKMNDQEDIKLFIQNFNEVLMGKKQFQEAVFRLEDALTSPETQYRAPTIASWFTSYLGKTLNKNINTFISKNAKALASQDFSAWEVEIDSIIDKSISQAFKNMLTKMTETTGKELYGNSETWREVYKASQAIEGFSDYFREMIRSKIDFSKLRTLLQNDNIKVKNKTNRGVRKVLDSQQGLNLRSGRKSRSIGGSVQEYIMTALTTLGEAASSATSTGARVFSSDMMKTDTVTVFSFNQQIDVGKIANTIADQLNEVMKDSTSLNDATEIMKRFYNDHLSNLDNSFIVYGSTKSYSLSDSFKGFHGGGERNLSDAVAIIQQAGIGNPNAVDNYIKAAYNTGSGAIFSDKRLEIQEDLKIALMSAVAELLFDDWISIGEGPSGGAKAIHILQLEGLQIPLSVFLTAAGKAMTSAASDMEKIIKVRVKLPGKILYEEPIKTAGGHMSEILSKWNEQAQVAENESVFSIEFLKNFKTIISEWINF